MNKFNYLLTALLVMSLFKLQAQTLKLNESFESTTFPPTGWSSVNLLGSNEWMRVTNVCAGLMSPVTGTKAAYVSYSYPAGGNDWLITPQMNVSAGDSISFFIAKHYEIPYPPDSLFIRVSTSSPVTDSFTTTIATIDVSALPRYAWVNMKLPLSAFTGQNIYIAFARTDMNGNGLYLDNVTMGNSSALPVKLINFSCTAQSDQAQLQWSTASETNNNGFYVERAIGQSAFEPIGFVKGNGTTAKLCKYFFTDKNIALNTTSQVIYYRLKQVDYDGAFEYSAIVSASLVNTEKPGIAPNPFKNEFQLALNMAENGTVSVSVSNMQQQTVYEQSITVAKGNNNISVTDLNHLPAGTYFITINTGRDTQRYKVLKVE